MKTAKGKVVDVELLSFPFVFDDIDVEGESTITIVRDIRERKENEKLVVRNEKLGIAGQLAASIAHEIRNPLTAIKGFLKLEREGSVDIDIYSIIDREIDRIETIAGELLVLGKPVSTKVKKAEVGRLIRSVCTLMQSQANFENITINVEVEQHDIFISCNEEQIKQVFINIIKNAIEAIKHEGTINVRVSVDREDVIIAIADDGEGIPERIKKRLGEPFYSTKEKGTGLGLMVCYNIIEQHDGQINFHSRVGEGTVFTIRLPLLKSEET